VKTFVPVDDASLVNLIKSAQRRIVFIAPGMTLQVADALGARTLDMNRLDVTVVLDADEDVFRVGYGELAALKRLQELANEGALSLRSQKGLRVGVMLSDDNIMVWSPTPRSVEAPPNSRFDEISATGDRSVAEMPWEASSSFPALVAPNGLMLGPNPVEQLAKAVSVGDKNTPTEGSEIGRAPITDSEVQRAAAALAKNPPIPVDLARVTRVFSTKLQFVEFKVTRAKLSRMKLTVPRGLLNADANEELEGLIESKLSAFGDMRDIEIEVPAFVNGVLAESAGKPLVECVTEGSLERERHAMEKRFLYDIVDFGRLIEKDRKGEFQRLVEAYETRLIAHAKGVRLRLDIEAVKIVDYALELIGLRRESGKAQGKSIGRVNEDRLRSDLMAGLQRAKSEVPTVKLIFKDVTYEQTQSEDFRGRLERALPVSVRNRLGAWNEHFDAAQRRQQ
jgi:hypothetical protein